jgi:hypothetical protein
MPSGEKTKINWDNPEYKKRMMKIRAKQIPYWLGKKMSLEARKKMSLAKVGKMPSNIEQLKAMPRWNKGLKGVEVGWSKGKKLHYPVWNKGLKIDKSKYPTMGHHVKHSKEAIQKMKLARKGKSAYWNKGDKSPMWKGGISPINKIIRRSIAYKEWREAVFKRDNYTCQECGQKGGTLHPHHIKPFAYYPELRFAIGNGITLCIDCHKKTDTYARKGK